jgi:hypothetical protein
LKKIYTLKDLNESRNTAVSTYNNNDMKISKKIIKKKLDLDTEMANLKTK